MPQIGLVTKQSDGSYTGQLRSLSIKANIRIVPNHSKTADRQPDYLVLAGGVEIGAGWDKVGKNSGEPYVGLSLAAPEFGPRKLYANLGQAAGQDDEDLFAIIWNPVD